LALLAAIPLLRGNPGDVSGWALRLGWHLVITGLPALGMMTLVATAVHSLWRVLFAGLVLGSTVGLLGVAGRKLDYGWAPGSLDRALFSGRAEAWSGAMAMALGWLLAGLALALGLAAWRERRSRRVRVQPKEGLA